MRAVPRVFRCSNPFIGVDMDARDVAEAVACPLDKGTINSYEVFWLVNGVRVIK
jgi:hypothetical protein